MYLSRNRSAFTLIELLVALAIIGILTALIVPAVQQAREAARMTQCRNNLKQLGLALHNYHATHGVFPYSSAWDGSYHAPSTNFHGEVLNHRGWLHLLPYLDQGPLYNKFDFNQATGYYAEEGTVRGDVIAAGHDVLVASILETLICPSDPGQKFTTAPFFNSHPDSEHFGARTTYDFSVEQTWRENGENWIISEPKQERRMFGQDSCCSIRHILDGTSNTVAVCETTLERKDGECASWGFSKWVANGIDFAHLDGINRFACCSWDSPPYSSEVGLATGLGSYHAPGSYHDGGMHVLMGDGSVHFVSENIDTATRESLAYIADGGVIGEF